MSLIKKVEELTPPASTEPQDQYLNAQILAIRSVGITADFERKYEKITRFRSALADIIKGEPLKINPFFIRLVVETYFKLPNNIERIHSIAGVNY